MKERFSTFASEARMNEVGTNKVIQLSHIFFDHDTYRIVSSNEIWLSVSETEELISELQKALAELWKIKTDEIEKAKAILAKAENV